MNALILRELDEFSLHPEAVTLRESALEKSALIGKVDSPTKQQDAVDAQLALKSVLNLLEKHRKLAKEPLIEAGRKLDNFVKSQSEELEAEGLRIATAIGDYQEAERERIAAAERLQNQKMTALEQERDMKLTTAQTVEEADAIREEFSNRASEIKEPIREVKAAGQVVNDDWEITVTDMYALVTNHFGCVKCEPKLSEIKKLLNRGAKLEGISAKPIVKSTVRARPVKEINV